MKFALATNALLLSSSSLLPTAWSRTPAKTATVAGGEEASSSAHLQGKNLRRDPSSMLKMNNEEEALLVRGA